MPLIMNTSGNMGSFSIDSSVESQAMDEDILYLIIVFSNWLTPGLAIDKKRTLICWYTTPIDIFSWTNYVTYDMIYFPYFKS